MSSFSGGKKTAPIDFIKTDSFISSSIIKKSKDANNASEEITISKPHMLADQIKANGNHSENWMKREKGKQEELLSPHLDPKYFPAKKAVSILAIIQLMLASSHFIENTVLLHRNFFDFYDSESRLVVTIIWIFTICWILCTVILFIGLFASLPSFLLTHIVFLIFWLLCNIIILFIMLISRTSLPSVLFVFVVCVTIIVSLPYEWNCYRLMLILL